MLFCGLGQVFGGGKTTETIAPKCPFCSKAETSAYGELSVANKDNWIWQGDIKKFACRDCVVLMRESKRQGTSKRRAVKLQEWKLKSELSKLREVPSGCIWESSESFTQQYQVPVHVSRKVARAVLVSKMESGAQDKTGSCASTAPVAEPGDENVAAEETAEGVACEAGDETACTGDEVEAVIIETEVPMKANKIVGGLDPLSGGELVVC